MMVYVPFFAVKDTGDQKKVHKCNRLLCLEFFSENIQNNDGINHHCFLN